MKSALMPLPLSPAGCCWGMCNANLKFHITFINKYQLITARSVSFLLTFYGVSWVEHLQKVSSIIISRFYEYFSDNKWSHLLMVKQCCPRNNRSGQVINRILNEKGYRFCQKKGLMLIWMPARGWQQYNHQARQQKNINTNSLQTVGIWAAVIYPVPIQDPAVIVSSNIYHWQNIFLFVSLCWQDRN